MIRFVEKNKRGIAIFMLLNFLNSTFFPTVSMALTSGPSQPEASSFTPVSTSDMVNLFTGDLNYNIPLLDVGGYPVNISYNGGSFMDQEASWVGLGWNINVGAINRNMRGLPDDFAGDNVVKELNTKPNETYGVSISASGELFGFNGLQLSPSMGVSYNNYNGYNITKSLGLSVVPIAGFPGTAGLGLSSSSDGLTISPSLGCSMHLWKQDKYAGSGNVSIGTSYNSRSGLKQVSFSGEINTIPFLKGVTKGSYGYNFGAATYVPNVAMPMHTSSYLFSLGLGGTGYGVDVTGNITGNYSKQILRETTESIPAYGYLYAHAGEKGDKVMLDFNREKDGAFSENTVMLPLTNHTYDLYNVSGQGISGSYRATRSDIGYVFDSRVTTDSESDNLSTEIELGGTAKPGIDYYQTNTEQTSGKWSDGNVLTSRLQFRANGNDPYYEPAYFKESGEMVLDEDGLFANVHSNNSVRPDFETAGFDSYTNYNMVGANGFSGTLPSSPYRTKRAKRNQQFSYLTKGEYSIAALQTSLYGNIPVSIPDHHIAEITTTKTDGSRYVFGLPVFNTKQIERTFNISGAAPNNGMVDYDSGVDDSKNNSRGIDNYFSSLELPGYAYSYLLTAVLSPDYVDITGNGPSADDLGNYTLFEYTAPTDYKWRTPFVSAVSGEANFDEGLKTDPNDNKATYVYGEKQISYLSRIHTKNYIAVFNMEDRRDGLGVTGTNGLTNTGVRQKLLKSIQLYSKPDYAANPSTAFVIKQVNFVYDYSLCQGIPNNVTSPTATLPYETSNSGGKLTLKKIYMTYGTSSKGHLSPYEFTYNTTVNTGVGTATPTYDMKAVDRWGTYKPTGVVPNAEAPYTPQDKNLVDSYAALWNLKTITLPSGGKINITLESDDYAFVQNKRAGQMFNVIGAGNSNPGTGVPTNYAVPTNTLLYGGGNNYCYLFFKLDQNIPLDLGTPAAVKRFKQHYMDGIDDVHFRFFTPVNGNYPNPQGYEYVSGYAEVVSSGIVSTGTVSADYGWIQLKEVARGDKRSNCTFCENPISKAAWQFGKMHTPQAVFSINGNIPSPGGSVSNFLKSMANASFLKNTIEFFMGVNGRLKARNYGHNFVADKSWIRLNSPSRFRLGGGNRVKRITLSDEWAGMVTVNATGKSSEYGQDYRYEAYDNLSSHSSGVAAYEPGFGANENACRYPIYNSSKKEELLLAPDNDLYQEGPVGESFFPAPSIGYSRVVVSNLAHAGVTKNSTGEVVNEFYTAKDFPVIVHKPTDLKLKRQKSNPLQKILHLEFEDNMTASQGYCIELNDMHGKQKKNEVYDATGSRISASTYTYRQKNGQLNNEVPYMNKNGAIEKGVVGVEFDMVTDFREQSSQTESIGIQGNLYFMLLGIFPLIVPTSIPSYHKEKVRFRSAVATKVVHRFGILEKVEVEDNGSIVETSNVMWDGETGQVLLTKSNTEFNDDIFNYNYPAYYSYSGMEPAYKNTGITLSFINASDNQGKVFPAYKDYFEPGDECILYNNMLAPVFTNTANTTLNKCWVRKQGNDFYLIDAAGANVKNNVNLSSAVYMKVVRSGKRNMQSMNSGNITTFNSPVNLDLPSTSWPALDATRNVLNAGAVEYGNTWRTFCNCGLANVGAGNSNEYLNGIGGIWRQLRAYTYLTLRKQTNLNNNTNIRRDGVFEKFDPFWSPAGGADWTKPNDLNSTSPKWTWASEVTEYSPYGFELENKDALGRYSSAVYGYNNTLPVAVGANTRYRQMATDNFEDYFFNGCADDAHFSFKSVGTQSAQTHVVGNTSRQKFAHTGLKSIKVAAGATPVIVTKDLKPCP